MKKNEKKVDRRIQKTKQSLYEAFVTLVQKKPYSSITISALSEEANIDRRTFYLHYTCIDDVAKEMQAIACEMLIKKVNEQEDYQIDTFLACTQEVFESKHDFYRVIFTDPSCSHFIKDCVASLKYCVLNTNKNSSLVDTRKEYYAEYIANGIIGTYAYWFRQEQPAIDLSELNVLLKDSILESFHMVK